MLTWLVLLGDAEEQNRVSKNWAPWEAKQIPQFYGLCDFVLLLMHSYYPQGLKPKKLERKNKIKIG